MAYLIPENLRSRRDVSPGVARFAAALRDGLDDDVIVWYEPMFDGLGKRPDLVVLHPSAGILVLEVLESRASVVRGVHDGRLVVLEGEHERHLQSPLDRATEFARHLGRSMDAEARLPAADRLPVAAGAVFPYLSREAASIRRFDSVLQPERCLFRDDIETAARGSVEFRRALTRMLGAPLRDPLSEESERIIRALIHPDTVIGSRQLPFPGLVPPSAEDELLVLDRKQEALAKTLGVGHRVIRGPAGSGKTLVLTYRARLLAEMFPRHSVLVTCYTRSLAGRLRTQLKPWRNITVSTLDNLMASARRAAELEVDDYNEHSREALAERAVRALDDRPDQGGRFHHVLIDEAQDFPAEALRFAVRLLVEGSDSLLVAADPVQNIYRTRFSWKAAGIDAVGRTKWLDQCYRNTRQILEFAHKFVMSGREFTVAADPDPDDASAIMAPHFSPRNGPLPLILESPSRQAEVVNMAAHCRNLLAAGAEPGDIAILYGVTWMAGFNWPETIVAVFANQGIPLWWASDRAHPERRDHIGEDPSKILLCTIASAKGLEFRHVLLCGFLDDRPPDQSQVTRSLIYVGMTRATHELVLSASGQHPYLAELERS